MFYLFISLLLVQVAFAVIPDAKPTQCKWVDVDPVVDDQIVLSWKYTGTVVANKFQVKVKYNDGKWAVLATVDGSKNRYVARNLAPGQYYFTIAAKNGQDVGPACSVKDAPLKNIDTVLDCSGSCDPSKDSNWTNGKPEEGDNALALQSLAPDATEIMIKEDLEANFFFSDIKIVSDNGADIETVTVNSGEFTSINADSLLLEVNTGDFVVSDPKGFIESVTADNGAHVTFTAQTTFVCDDQSHYKAKNGGIIDFKALTTMRSKEEQDCKFTAESSGKILLKKVTTFGGLGNRVQFYAETNGVINVKSATLLKRVELYFLGGNMILGTVSDFIDSVYYASDQAVHSRLEGVTNLKNSLIQAVEGSTITFNSFVNHTFRGGERFDAIGVGSQIKMVNAQKLGSDNDGVIINAEAGGVVVANKLTAFTGTSLIELRSTSDGVVRVNGLKGITRGAHFSYHGSSETGIKHGGITNFRGGKISSFGVGTATLNFADINNSQVESRCGGTITFSAMKFDVVSPTCA